MKRVILAFGSLVLLGGLGAPGTAWSKPDWCPNAKTDVEILICSDQDLSDLDVRMTTLYLRLTRGDSGAAGEIRSQQASWRGSRDACGARSSCLLERYKERIRQLEAATGSRGRGSISTSDVQRAFERYKADWVRQQRAGVVGVDDSFPAYVADVNGDGHSDGLVSFNGFVPVFSDGGGNAAWYMGFPYFENIGGELVYRFTLDGELNDGTWEPQMMFGCAGGGLVHLQVSRHTEDDPGCCPSIERWETYRLTSRGFRLESTPARSPCR